MHVLFVHKNPPAQFGHIARYLIDHDQFRCTFVSEKPPAQLNGLERIQYRCKSGATEDTHFFSRSFVNQIWHSHALFEALEARPDIQPDLIVGHSEVGNDLRWHRHRPLASDVESASKDRRMGFAARQKNHHVRQSRHGSNARL